MKPGRESPARVLSKRLAPSAQEWGANMSADDGMPSADQVEAAEAGQTTHPQEPHAGSIAGRLNWLRAAVLGANDGIVSVAGIVIGVAGATTSRGPIFTAGLAGLVGGLCRWLWVSTSQSPASGTASARKSRWKNANSL